MLNTAIKILQPKGLEFMNLSYPNLHGPYYYLRKLILMLYKKHMLKQNKQSPTPSPVNECIQMSS